MIAALGENRIYNCTFARHHFTCRLCRVNFRHHKLWWKRRQTASPTVNSEQQSEGKPPYIQLLARKVLDLDTAKLTNTKSAVLPVVPPTPNPRARCEQLPPMIVEYLIEVGVGQIQVWLCPMWSDG